MWTSEPGVEPDARGGQPAPDGRAGLNGWNGQGEWYGTPYAPMEPQASSTALEQTQPRLAAPPPNRAAPLPVTGAGSGRETSKRRRITDSARMPALRLNRRDRAPRVEQKPRMVYDTERAPVYLRLARLVAGLALLAAAWGVALLVVYLAQALWDVLPRQSILTERFVLYLLDATGILWLAVVTVGLIFVGAFSLFLALTRREW
jgi:hypothetical protein